MSQNKTNKVATKLFLSPSHRKWLRAAAHTADISMSQVVRRLINKEANK
jgi:hypothetical protein